MGIMEKIKDMNRVCRFWHGMSLEKDIMTMDAKNILELLKGKAEMDTTKDWGNSLYLAYDEDVSKGYVDHMGGIVYLIQLELVADMPCVCSNNKVYAYGNTTTPTSEVKNEIEKLFQKNIGDSPFMNFLGEQGYAYRCFVDDDFNLELIVPSTIICTYLKVVSVKKARFDIHSNEFKELDYKKFD